MPSGSTYLQTLHRRGVHSRRVRVLADRLSEMIPDESRVLDVGCGDGQLAYQTRLRNPSLEFVGLDVLVRNDTAIPVEPFDGQVLPYNDESFDVVLFVDVLHHTDNPHQILAEAKRVTRDSLVIKDHLKEGLFANTTLRFMDWVGNASYGVHLPYRYWTKQEWEMEFRNLNVSIDSWSDRLNLYPNPAGWLFDRGLHFLARLGKGGTWQRRT